MNDGMFMTISSDMAIIWSEVSMALMIKVKCPEGVWIMSGGLSVENWVTMLLSDGNVYQWNKEEFIEKGIDA